MASMLDKLKKRSEATQTVVEREILVPLEKLRFDPTQPRKAYHTLDGRVAEKDQAYIEELAASIKANGLIQAITVEECEDGTYLVRVGECRARAHLLNGEKDIRAVVNNNLKTRMDRLLYQLAENVTRNSLTDLEVAGAVKELMEDNGDEPPLNQTQVAQKLGKSEGWVTRFVTFGNEELQRRWVHTGIADTAEKVYRLKLLPPPLQLEILRRVELPANDPEHLEKPLNRSIIDDFGAKAKMEKVRQREAKATDAARPKDGEAKPVTTTPQGATGRPDANDTIGQALAEAAASGSDITTQREPSLASNEKYALPEEVRQSLLSSTPQEPETDKRGKKAKDNPPINCRVLVSSLEALLPLLRTDPKLLKAMRSVQCEVSLPGDLARAVASALVGVVVDDSELPATVQNELAKLG